MIHGPKGTQQLAARLRREMSLPEVILWAALRKRPGGLRFRRQHPAGRYVLDFFCPNRRLCVEVDGEAHDRGDRPERDEARDAWLATQGVRVLRIDAADVLRDLDAVVAHVVHTAGVDRRGLPLHHASHGPPPPPGED